MKNKYKLFIDNFFRAKVFFQAFREKKEYFCQTNNNIAAKIFTRFLSDNMICLPNNFYLIEFESMKPKVNFSHSGNSYPIKYFTNNVALLLARLPMVPQDTTLPSIPPTLQEILTSIELQVGWLPPTIGWFLDQEITLSLEAIPLETLSLMGTTINMVQN